MIDFIAFFLGSFFGSLVGEILLEGYRQAKKDIRSKQGIPSDVYRN